MPDPTTPTSTRELRSDREDEQEDVDLPEDDEPDPFKEHMRDRENELRAAIDDGSF